MGECSIEGTSTKQDLVKVLRLPDFLDGPHFYFITHTDGFVLYIHPEALSEVMPHNELAPALGALPLSRHTDIFSAIVDAVPNYDHNTLWRLKYLMPELIATGKVAIFDARNQQFLAELKIVKYKSTDSGGRRFCVRHIGEWIVLFATKDWVS